VRLRGVLAEDRGDICVEIDAQALRDPLARASDSIEVLGAPPARVISERDRELGRMRQQGATIAPIARRFGISKVRVSQILDRDGW
jgi:DNA-directed RNA polymerase specialized sigma subunit